MSNVRKANSLTDFGELNLSEETLLIIKYMSIDNVISFIRHWNKRADEKVRQGSNWLLDVAIELDRLGFIRHDFDSKSFAVGKLYKTMSHTSYISRVCDLITNEQYETYRNLSPQEIDTVISTIDKVLKKDETQIIKLCFGLTDDSVRIEEPTDYAYSQIMSVNVERAAEIIGIDKFEARMKYRRAKNKLRRPGVLPPISQFVTC